jgi:hypothetical protein
MFKDCSRVRRGISGIRMKSSSAHALHTIPQRPTSTGRCTAGLRSWLHHMRAGRSGSLGKTPAGTRGDVEVEYTRGGSPLHSAEDGVPSSRVATVRSPPLTLKLAPKGASRWSAPSLRGLPYGRQSSWSVDARLRRCGHRKESARARYRPLPGWDHDITRESHLRGGACHPVRLCEANVMRIPERDGNSGGLSLHRH